MVPAPGIANVFPAQGPPEGVLALGRPGKHDPAGMLPAQQPDGPCAESLAAVPVGDFHEINLQPLAGFGNPVAGIHLGGSTTIMRTTSSPARRKL